MYLTQIWGMWAIKFIEWELNAADTNIRYISSGICRDENKGGLIRDDKSDKRFNSLEY